MSKNSQFRTRNPFENPHLWPGLRDWWSFWCQFRRGQKTCGKIFFPLKSRTKTKERIWTRGNPNLLLSGQSQILSYSVSDSLSPNLPGLSDPNLVLAIRSTWPNPFQSSLSQRKKPCNFTTGWGRSGATANDPSSNFVPKFNGTKVHFWACSMVLKAEEKFLS